VAGGARVALLRRSRAERKQRGRHLARAQVEEGEYDQCMGLKASWQGGSGAASVLAREEKGGA
jgi:hypothetical protein